MPVRPIDDNHHVVRHCPHRHLIIADEKVLGVFSDAFSLRLPKETFLSTTWLEFFDGEDRAARLKQTAFCLRDAGRDVRPNHGLAVCNVGIVIAVGHGRDRRLRILHEPNDLNPAYSAIRGLPPDNRDQELLSLIAQEACVEAVMVKMVD